MKIERYKIVPTNEVQRLIDKGWQPHGSAVVVDGQLLQPVVHAGDNISADATSICIALEEMLTSPMVDIVAAAEDIAKHTRNIGIILEH